MAKGPASDTIMGTDKMKPLLALSKRDPVQAAIGLTSDGEAIILLDKKAKPKKVLSMMRGIASKAKINLAAASLRFGRAEVDTDYDSGCVRFFVNKETPGNMRPKLVEIVKRIAYQKVEINVDTSLEEEPEEDVSGAGDTPSSSAMPEAAAVPEPPPPPPPPAPPADLGALRTELAGLIQKLVAAAGGDAARLEQMKQLAGQANASIKGADQPGAAALIAQLRELMMGPAPSAAPEATAFRREWGAAWSAWLDAFDTVESQIDMLGRVMAESGDPALETIAATGLGTLFADKKMPLTLAGLQLGKAGNDAALGKMVASARKAVDGFAGHIATDAKVAACDEVELGVSVAIRATLTPALQRLSDALAKAP
jgi:hypothetical protein